MQAPDLPRTIAHEVVVVGGGPAGSATAIALGQLGRSCALLEHSAYDRPRFGESLPPTARPLLRALGVWDRFLQDGHMASPGNLSVWGGATPGETDFIANPNGHGWHLDRLRFDRTLFDAASRTAWARASTSVLACARSADGWQLVTSGPDGVQRHAARFLVNATGRRRGLSQLTVGPADVLDHLLGIVGVYDVPAVAEADPRTWVEAVEDGWWYSAPVPGQRRVAAFMTDAAVIRSRGLPLASFFERQLERSALTGERMTGARPAFGFTILSASSYLSRRVVGADFLAVGDAAAAVDPLSSDGLCRALRDGLRAADAVDRHLSGDTEALHEHDAAVRRELARFARQQRWMYSQERRWPAAPFWHHRRAAAPTALASADR